MRDVIFYTIVIVLSAIWGGSQPALFPQETYGYMWVFTAFFGGLFIGYFGMRIKESLNF